MQSSTNQKSERHLPRKIGNFERTPDFRYVDPKNPKEVYVSKARAFEINPLASEHLLYLLEKRNLGPKSVRVNPRLILYRVEDIASYDVMAVVLKEGSEQLKSWLRQAMTDASIPIPKEFLPLASDVNLPQPALPAPSAAPKIPKVPAVSAAPTAPVASGPTRAIQLVRELNDIYRSGGIEGFKVKEDGTLSVLIIYGE